MVQVLRFLGLVVLLVVLGSLAVAVAVATAGSGVGFAAVTVVRHLPTTGRLMYAHCGLFGYLFLALLHFGGHDELVCCVYLLFVIGHAWKFRAQLWQEVILPAYDLWDQHRPCCKTLGIGRKLLRKIVATAAGL